MSTELCHSPTRPGSKTTSSWCWETVRPPSRSMARKKNETGPAAPERGGFIGDAWTDLDVPGSFASAPYFRKGLVSAGKKPPERLAALLKTRPDFRKLSRPSKKTFPTRPFPAFFFNDRWEMDLFDMGREGWRAGGKPQRRFILLAVDVFSRKLFSACLKNKTAAESAKGLAKILAGLKPPYGPPRLLHTDKGREFRAEFAELLKKEGIRHVLIDHTLTKARYAERAVRSFKRVLMGYINTRKTTPSRQRWLSTVARVTSNLNRRFHRGLGMAPDEVPRRWKEVHRKLLRKEKDQPSHSETVALEEAGGDDPREAFSEGDRVWAKALPKNDYTQRKESDLAWIQKPEPETERKKKRGEKKRNYRPKVAEHVVVDVLKDRRPYLYKLRRNVARSRPLRRHFYAEELTPAETIKDRPDRGRGSAP